MNPEANADEKNLPGYNLVALAIFEDEVADVEVVVEEGFVEVVHAAEAVAVDGLLGEVVEEVLDEGAVRSGGFHGEAGEVARAGNFDDLIFFGGVVARGVDGLVEVLGPEAADGVVILKTEADGVDDGVAGHAVFVLGQFGDLLPHGEVWLEVRVLELDGLRWRLKEAAEDIATQVDSAMDGRSLVVV